MDRKLICKYLDNGVDLRECEDFQFVFVLCDSKPECIWEYVATVGSGKS